MMQNKIFRKVSLDRLSSPEQLDQVMQVTTLRGWLALGAISLLLLTALVWGVVGSVGERVAGSGILVRSGGVLEVVASAGGRVEDVAVAVGDSVSEGQVIARLAQPDLFEQLEQARTTLQALGREQAQTVAFQRREGELQEQALLQQEANLRQSIVSTGESLRALEERLRNQELLVQQGLITKSTLLGTRQQGDQARERMRADGSSLAQLSVQRLDVQNRREQALRASELKLEQARAQVAQLEREYSVGTQVTSPYTGRILEIMSETGKIVARGEPLLSLDLTGGAIQELMAVVYVPSVHGKRVQRGMQIQIAPTTVRQEEYGLMLGTVTFVSNFPSTPRGMLRVLKNDQLVQALSGGAAPYEVHATLAVDPGTASRYRWSSSKGPPMRIESGTLASAQVRVNEDRPIAKVIPLLRRWTGI
jgi:HlyD family secretion protein